MKNAALFFLFIQLLSISSCNNNPVEPGEDIQPGRRDYVWTIDTLKVSAGKSTPNWIWGSKADDIWAVGSAYFNDSHIWHYDGKSWNDCFQNLNIDPRGIAGFSQNDIWIGSTDGSLWHYDGTVWERTSPVITAGYFPPVIQGLGGRSADDIFAIGFADSRDSTYKAIINHYNGEYWEIVDIPIIQQSFVKIFYDKQINNFLISAWEFDTSKKSIYVFNGTTLEKVYDGDRVFSMNSISDRIYFSQDGLIYRFDLGKISVFKDFKNTNFSGGFWGRNEKDIFTINWDGIGHYNGTNLITLFKKRNNDWFPDGGILFERDVFFLWDDNLNTYVIHGILQN